MLAPLHYCTRSWRHKLTILGNPHFLFWHLSDNHAHLSPFDILTQAGNVTARWDIFALKLLKLIQLVIRDDSTMWMTAELNYPQLAAGVDVDGEVMDEDYSPSPGSVLYPILLRVGLNVVAMNYVDY